MKIQLKRSNVTVTGVAKKPTAAQMEYGELAVNYNKDDPSLFIKGNDNSIIRLAGRDSASIPDGTGNIGAIGYWNRSGTELTTINPGDDVTLTGDLTADKGILTSADIGSLTFSGNNITSVGNVNINASGNGGVYFRTKNANGNYSFLTTDESNTANLRFNNITSQRSYSFPDKPGTIALTSDVSAIDFWSRSSEALTPSTTTDDVNIGSLTFSGNNITSVGTVNISAAGSGQINFRTKNSNGNYSFLTTDESNTANLRFNNITTTRSYSFPDKAGTIALTSDVSGIEEYELGTYTPFLTSTTGTDPTQSYAFQNASYVRIGNLCSVEVTIKFASSGITSGTEAVQVNLPFNVSGNPSGSISISKVWTSNTPVAIKGRDGTNFASLKLDLNSGNASCADVKNNTQINFSLVYEVA